MWLGVAMTACGPEDDPHPVWTALDGNWTGEAVPDTGTDAERWPLLAVFGWDGAVFGGQLALDGFVYVVVDATDADGAGTITAALDADTLVLEDLTVAGDVAEGRFTLDTCDPAARLPACEWSGPVTLGRDP